MRRLRWYVYLLYVLRKNTSLLFQSLAARYVFSSLALGLASACVAPDQNSAFVDANFLPGIITPSPTATASAPVAANITPAVFNQNTQSGVITLSYTDIDTDLATACTISNLINVTVTQACACAAGVCTLRVTGTLNYAGAAYFDYTVTANGDVSNVATASLSITAVNTAPVASNITPAAFNEDTQSGVITLSYTDIDTDLATTCTISNLSNVTVTQACACASGVCTLRVKGTSNYNGAGSFDYTVTANGQTSNTASASLTITAVNDAPVASAISPAAFNEDTQSGVITLSYTDTESQQATACTISNLSNVTVTQACACAAGVCTLRVTGTSNYSGAASFDYTVTAGGQTSAVATASLTINAVDDAPVAANITPAAFNEDTQSGVITLSYTDTESQQATACTISNLSNVTVTQACACAAGVCTLRVTGTSNYSGAASFDYTVTAGGQTSAAATASLTINAVDDAPVAANITPAAFNEDTQSGLITLSYTDVESDLAGSCTISNLSNVTVTSACACVAGVCTLRVTGTSNYNGAASFDYTVTAGGQTSATATASLTINAVDDAPVAANITPAAFKEDFESATITLSYTDAESHQATACTISNLSGVTVTQTCACATGVCTLKVTGTLNQTGAASFDYTVTAGGQTSATATASLTIDAVTASVANSTITGTGSVVANGTATSTVTITLISATGDPVIGTTPTFTATDTGTTNTYGTCSVSNSSSVSTCTLASTKAETKTLSIATPVSKSDGTVTFQAGSVDSGTTTISATSPIDADGSSTSTITVTLRDANSNPISGTIPTVTVGGTRNTVSTCSSTNASGVSTCTVSSYKGETKSLALATPVSVSGNNIVFSTVGMKLATYIDMTSGIGSTTAARNFTKTTTAINTNFYDGTVRYYWEIIASNADSGDEIINLQNVATTTNVTFDSNGFTGLTVPAGSNMRRFIGEFTPPTGASSYTIVLPQTSAIGDVTVATARIIVVQTGATKTRVYIPLIAGFASTSAGAATAVDSTTSGTYVQPNAMNYPTWTRRDSNFDEIASGTPWTLEALVSIATGGTAQVGLHDSSGNLIAETAAHGGTTPTIRTVSFASNATNFVNGGTYSIRIKNTGAAGTTNLMRAGLWVTLSELYKSEIPILVARGASSAGSTGAFQTSNRYLYNSATFTNPRTTYESSGFAGTTNCQQHLIDAGTSTAGTGAATSTHSWNVGTSYSTDRTNVTLGDGIYYIGRFTCSPSTTWTTRFGILYIVMGMP
jgi:hypothetical protein